MFVHQATVSYGVPRSTISDEILNFFFLINVHLNVPLALSTLMSEYHLFCSKFGPLSDNYLLDHDMFGMQLFGCFVCLFVLLLYVPSRQLWSLRDGQFT